jgi:hypothetical protein
MDNVHNTVCYNCERPVAPRDNYCAYCGQANHPTKLTLLVLIKDFIINFFDLDSKFFKTLRHIYAPSFLTREYLAGRRKSYSNPIRLFIITMFVFFAVMAFTFNEKVNIDLLDQQRFNFDATVSKSEVYDNYNHLIDSLELNDDQQILDDTIRNSVFKSIEISDSNYLDLTNSNIVGVEMKKVKFLRKDIIELEPDSLFRKYNIEQAWDKIVIKQILKTIENPSSTVRALIANSFWTVILIIIFVSFLMKLLFIRHRIYLIEHIILQCNVHSLSFILGSVFLVLVNILGLDLSLANYFLLLLAVLMFISFKGYYRQGIFKTLIKIIIYLFGYFFMLIFCLMFVALVSFMLL